MGRPSQNIFLLLLLLLSMAVGATESCSSCSALVFKENKGQWNKNVLYKTEMHFGSVFFEPAGITYVLLDTGDMQYFRGHHPFKVEYKAELNTTIRCHTLKCNFVNANPKAVQSGTDKLDEYFNYFIGSDRSKWKSEVNAYRQITYTDIYPGTDLHVYSENQNLKYDWVLKANKNHSMAPAADRHTAIQIQYNGADDLSISDGKLIIKTSVGSIIESRPYAYQAISGQKKQVPCAFELKNGVVSFVLPEGYDVDHDLIIDPTLIFSTYSGSTSDNFGYTATYDSKGNAYAAGSVFGPGYRTTAGAFRINWAGGYIISTVTTPYNFSYDSVGIDIGITKYKADGTARLYSTYLGGSADELPHSMVVNSNDELIIFGTTSSNDFPMTATGFDTSFNGGPSPGIFFGLGVEYHTGSDICVTRFNQNGTAILGSTYLGGTGNDGLNYPEYNDLHYQYADEVRGVVDVDKDDNIYITSCTRSTDFPTTPGAYQTTLRGQLDGVLVKMNSDLSRMIWGTYLGGEGRDAIYSLALDTSGNVFVCGGTQSDSFPTTAGTFQTVNHGGRAEGFITLFSKTGSSIIRSTMYGTPTYDQLFLIQTDRKNNVYVLGQTFDTTSAFTKNALYNIPKSGQYISKFNYNLDTLVWSTRFGTGRGIPDISPTAFLVDRCNSVYVAGWGSNLGIQGSPDLSTRGLFVTPNAYQTATDGSDFYVMVMKDDASAITYATYFGSPVSEDHVDGGTSRFDKKGVIYESVCAGCGGNSAFPTYPANVVSHTNNSPNCNNAIFKLDLDVPLLIADFQAPISACDTAVYQLINKSKIIDTPNTVVRWDFGDGSFSSSLNPIHTYTHPGTYVIKLTLVDVSSCNGADSVTKTVVIHQNDSTTQLPTLSTCGPNNLQIGLPPVYDTTASYRWYPGTGLSDSTITNPIVRATATASYELIVTKGNCHYIYHQKVQLEHDTLNVTGSNALCPNDTIQLHATDSAHLVLTYSWSPASGILSGGNTASPFVKPAQNMTYYVTATSANGCVYHDSITVRVVSSLPSVFATATPDSIAYGDTTTLHVFYPPLTSRIWDMDSTLSSITVDSPLAFPLHPQTYWVTVADSNGCKVRDSVRVFIKYTPCATSNLYVPNAFSPNNDGKNDKFIVRGNFIQDMYFAVYDRWGQKMFETRDQGTGWDGTYQGSKLDPAVFGWYLEGTCETGGRFFKKGNVTLLR